MSYLKIIGRVGAKLFEFFFKAYLLLFFFLKKKFKIVISVIQIPFFAFLLTVGPRSAKLLAKASNFPKGNFLLKGHLIKKKKIN